MVRMKEIAYADGFDITDGAYRILASLAEGSMRDGLSIMERVISACGNHVSAKDIEDTLGISSSDFVFELTNAITDGDAGKVVEIIDKAVSDGKELPQLATSMLSHFRSLMLCKVSPNPESLIDTDAQTLVKLKAQSEKLSFDKINHATTVISSAMADARVAKSSRIVYELAFIKLARPDMDSTPEAVMDRLSTVENKLMSQGIPQVTQQTVADNSDIIKRLELVENAIKNGVTATVIDETEPKPEPEKKSSRMFVPIPEDELNFDYPTAVLARNWEKLIKQMMRLNMPLAMPLRNCIVTFDREGLILLVPEDRNQFTERTAINNIDEIRKLFKQVTNTDYTLKIAMRNEFDPKNILNAFSLPKTEVKSDIVVPEDNVKESEPQDKKDKLDEFFEQYESIITDGDKQALLSGESITRGEQSTFDDDDESEEFLDASELPSDDEE